jgi:hypothetical protein
LFKTTSITLAEKRSVDLNSLLNVKTTGETNTPVFDKFSKGIYSLCVPCDSIVLEVLEDKKYESKDESSAGSPETPPAYFRNGNCYTLNKEGVSYTIATKEGAIKNCGSKVRMTLNDLRSAAKPEVDSVVFNIVPNSSAYDYTSADLGGDEFIENLIKDYDKAKVKAKDSCTKDKIKEMLDTMSVSMGVGIAGGVVAGVAGAVDTTVQSVQVANTYDEKKPKFNKDSVGGNITAAVTGGVAGLANTATAVGSFVSVSQFKELKDHLDSCKKAVEDWRKAGIALEYAMEELMSADVVDVESKDEKNTSDATPSDVTTSDVTTSDVTTSDATPSDDASTGTNN